MTRPVLSLAPLAAALLASHTLLAGFAGTDLYIAATARATGTGGAQFYSTLWVTNLSTGSPAHVTYAFLQQGQANPSPTQVSETLQPGETRRYENVVATLFGKDQVGGAIRITSDVPVLASSRTYDQPPGTDIRNVKGLFFGAIPASFAIQLGEVAHLQGITQSGGEDYRYNWGVVEISGASAQVAITLRGENGQTIASKTYSLAAFEALQRNVSDLGTVATTNGRLEANVVSGSGRVLFYGTQIANGSQDSAGFEMSFKDGLLVSNVSSEEGSPATESYTAATTSSVTSVAKSATDLAPSLGITLGTVRLETLTELPASASYDPVTGTWSVSLTLSTGQSAHLQIQFRDSSGNAQRLYNPLTTDSISVKGDATGAKGYAAFDLLLTNVKLGSGSVTVNGTGTATVQGVSGTFTVSQVIVPKSNPPYPTSGTIVFVAGTVTVTVTFDGTQYAQGTYEMRGKTYTFTIDLLTGEVTPT